MAPMTFLDPLLTMGKSQSKLSNLTKGSGRVLVMIRFRYHGHRGNLLIGLKASIGGGLTASGYRAAVQSRQALV